ncbi:MAG: hypothetical protein NC337_11495 [Roseburia sp.]|nr:hypothetical protein [Roseburia sp.]
MVHRRETTGRMIFFFFFCNYFLGSAIKWYLGSPENTLAESFWDAEARTWLHYGIAVSLADIALLFCVLGIWKRWGRRAFELFDAGMLVLLLVVGFCRGGITNTSYCVVFVLSLFLSGAFLCLGKRELTFYTGREYGKAFRKAAPAIGLWVITAGIYLPNELYISNAGEFTAPYGEFFWILLSGSLLIGFLLITAVTVLLPREFYKPFVLAASGVSVMSWIQGSFLNGKLQELTGEEQLWPAGLCFLNAAVWVAVISVIVIGVFRKTGIEKVCQAACVYIALIETVTLGWLSMTRDLDDAGMQQAMTTRDALTIAADENILVFVLDAFDSSYFDAILQEDADFAQPLADFTYYDNATSEYAHTSTAIPYLLEGVENTGGGYNNPHGRLAAAVPTGI